MKNIILDSLGHTHGFSKKTRKRTKNPSRWPHVPTGGECYSCIYKSSKTHSKVNTRTAIRTLFSITFAEHVWSPGLYDIDSLYNRLLRSLYYSLRAARARITRICSACDDRLFALIANNAVLLRPHATGGRTCN